MLYNIKICLLTFDFFRCLFWKVTFGIFGQALVIIIFSKFLNASYSKKFLKIFISLDWNIWCICCACWSGFIFGRLELWAKCSKIPTVIHIIPNYTLGPPYFQFTPNYVLQEISWYMMQIWLCIKQTYTCKGDTHCICTD